MGRIQREGSPIWGYRTGEIAYAAAHAHLAYYRILERRGEAQILRTRQDFNKHKRTWLDATHHATLPIGMVLGMEGADPILWPEQVHEWWGSGLRVISLAHYGVSTYAHGTGRPGGLLADAKPLLSEMETQTSNCHGFFISLSQRHAVALPDSSDAIHSKKPLQKSSFEEKTRFKDINFWSFVGVGIA